METWISKAASYLPQKDLVVTIVGNKNDLLNREVSQKEGRDFAEKFSFSYFESSALTGSGIERTFLYVVSTIQTVHFIEFSL